MGAPVFISHSHEDEAAYSVLCLALDSSGVSRWDVSQLSLGQSLAEGLRSAIEQCSMCIFLATSRSIESKWCLAELGAFWGSGKRVVIYVADPTVDESKLPPQFLGNLRTTDANRLIHSISGTDKDRVQQIENGYSVSLGSLTINVNFGRIEEFNFADENHLIALPANEFFDDDCIHDTRSALGAFMQYHFKDSIPTIQALVKDALRDEPSEEVEKKLKIFGHSYGIGKCVFLDQPLSSRLRVAMVAVTTQRKNVGLHAAAHYVFQAIESIQHIMADNRLTSLYLPILGSGHGGLKGAVSLICMLIAFGELHLRGTNHNIREINIIVYKRNGNYTPSISETIVKSSLDLVSRLLEE